MLGFPCNQFAGQEPGSDAEVKTFCETRYDVTFPLFAKLEVNGAGAPRCTRGSPSRATRPDGPGDVKWNFAKFLVGKTGQVVARFEPADLAHRARSAPGHREGARRMNAADLCYTPATRLAAMIRAEDGLAGRDDARGARAHRAREPEAQRVLHGAADQRSQPRARRRWR